MSEQDETVVVIFRRWRNGDKTVIAIFPELDAGGGLCQMYEHVGQHGGGSYLGVIAQTVPTRYDEPDVVALQQELEGRGYKLRPRQRANYNTMRTKT